MDSDDGNADTNALIAYPCGHIRCRKPAADVLFCAFYMYRKGMAKG